MAMRTKRAERIRADLERRGVAPELSQTVSHHLEPFARELAPEAYEAVLAGVALAWSARPGEGDAVRGLPSRGELDEMQRLMGEFAGELRKLDEVLELLAAYLTRMRAQSAARGRTLH
ncbi:MAG: hypothetical protein R3263_12205 [Myxococcota bacterium]|nr:hypothetical protein [Myxococcota bacterium]